MFGALFVHDRLVCTSQKRSFLRRYLRHLPHHRFCACEYLSIPLLSMRFEKRQLVQEQEQYTSGAETIEPPGHDLSWRMQSEREARQPGDNPEDG